MAFNQLIVSNPLPRDEHLRGVGAAVFAVHEYRFELLQYQNVQAFVAVIEDLRRWQVDDWQMNDEVRVVRPDVVQAQIQ